MQTLYDLILAEQEKITNLEKGVQDLEAVGFKVEGGKIPTLKNRATELLNDRKHSNNLIIGSMRKGGNLKDRVGEIVDSYKYSLKFPWNGEERRVYNESMTQLGEVINVPEGLKCNSIFNPKEPEGKILLEMGGGALVCGVAATIFGGFENTYLGLLIGGVFGGLYEFIAKTGISFRKDFKSWKEASSAEIDYIDGVLERRKII